SSWAELTERLYADSWQEGLGRFRSDFAFRGVETPEAALRTGLMRLGGDYPQLEGHLLRNFRKYAYRDAVPFDSLWNWLALAQRIVNQLALFSMKSDPRARLDEWLERHGGLVRRVVIPARLKWEVRDKLDQANVTERVLFPGLDGLSRWLRRQYMPRDKDDHP